jgi:hypothetical protein
MSRLERKQKELDAAQCGCKQRVRGLRQRRRHMCATFKSDPLHATRVNKLQPNAFNEEPTTPSTSYSLYIRGYNKSTTRTNASPCDAHLASRTSHLAPPTQAITHWCSFTIRFRIFFGPLLYPSGSASSSSGWAVDDSASCDRDGVRVC